MHSSLGAFSGCKESYIYLSFCNWQCELLIHRICDCCRDISQSFIHLFRVWWFKNRSEIIGGNGYKSLFTSTIFQESSINCGFDFLLFFALLDFERTLNLYLLLSVTGSYILFPENILRLKSIREFLQSHWQLFYCHTIICIHGFYFLI